jgi:hypothetical protein
LVAVEAPAVEEEEEAAVADVRPAPLARVLRRVQLDAVEPDEVGAVEGAEGAEDARRLLPRKNLIASWTSIL